MKKRFWIRALFALIAIGLLVGGIGNAFRAGMWQGYQMGQAAASGEESTVPGWGYPWAPRGGAFGYGRGPYLPHAHWRGFRPFGLLRAVMTFVLLLFLFGLVAKAFGFWAWKRAWRATGKDWHKVWPHGHPPHGHPPHGPHGHWPHSRPPHGPMPPWCWGDSETDEEEPSEEQVAKVKPEAKESEN